MEHHPFYHKNTAIQLVASDDDLTEVVQKLKQFSELGLDLEFDQHRFTYGFNLCLIQVADGNGTCYIIDPLAIKNLTPFFHLMEDASIAKIIHHSNNDILLLNKLGCSIKNVIDTDVAAKILNYEKSSLATVMSEEFDVVVDESQQSSNWNKRPLTEDQLQYAAVDVMYLHQVYHRLNSRIKELNRWHWFEEENKQLERLVYTEPENPHLKLKNAFKLNYYQQFILKNLYAFRDTLAQKFNKPAPYIIANEALVELANNSNVDIHEWVNHTKGLHAALKKSSNEALLSEAFDKAKQEAKELDISHDYPQNRFQRPYKTAETEKRREDLTLIQKKIAEKYGEFVTRLIITQSLINDYSYSGQISCTKQYAQDIVMETAAEENIVLPTPLKLKDKKGYSKLIPASDLNWFKQSPTLFRLVG